MDSKVFFVFLLLVGISHGLECYIHNYNGPQYPEEIQENDDPVRVQCPAGFDACATRMYCNISKLITMYWKSTILIADTDEDGTDRFCAISQWSGLGFYPMPQVGYCTTTFRLDLNQNLRQHNICLCSEDLCNRSKLCSSSISTTPRSILPQMPSFGYIFNCNPQW